jgi:hypothetical protein
MVHVVLINIISFCGLFAWFKAMRKLIPLQPILLFCFVFFVPSVLFWGSGLLEEGLLLGGMGFAMLGTQRLIFHEKGISSVLMMMVGMMIMAVIKLHVLICLLPFLVVYFIMRSYAPKFAAAGYMGIIILAIIGALVLPYINRFPEPHSIDIGENEQLSAVDYRHQGRE